MSEPKRSGPIRRRVNSRRNSSCALPLDRLDWSRWWTHSIQIMSADTLEPYVFTYLHVMEDHKVHRVFCKLAVNPRVEFRNGRLYWLIDNPGISAGAIWPDNRISVYNGPFGDVTFIDHFTVL